MKLVPVTSPKMAQKLSNKGLPVLAIDLGFASSSKSCGISHRLDELTFAQCVQETVKWLTQHEQKSETVLILEAPLSGCFNQGGNPVARATFEETHNHTNEDSDRRWNVRAGAAMGLAAIHFLRLLIEKSAGVNRTVYLVEGFASRYARGQKPSHQQVANALNRAWRTQAWLKTENQKPELIVLGDNTDSTVFASVGWFAPDLKSQPPVILRLPDGLRKQQIDLLYH